jgi:hypothetical protein
VLAGRVQAIGRYRDRLNDAGGVAERLFPLGRGKPIVLDPDRGFGEPTVPSVGVRTEILAELVESGEEPRRVAEVYS